MQQIITRLGLPPAARQQYAALCYRMRKKPGRVEVLIATSRGTGRWIIPKGWPMQGKRPHEVAAREAYEEAGIRGTAEAEALGHYRYWKLLDDGIRVPVRVQVHALAVRRCLSEFPEKGARELQWVSCEEAAQRVMEPELRQLFAQFAQAHPAHPAGRMQ